MSLDKKNQLSWSSWHYRLHKKLIEDKNFIPAKSSLLLSVSGGQDSMALLKLLMDLKRLHKWELNIWHGDHAWHAKSKKFSTELKAWCKKQNLNIYCDKANIEETKTEEASRNWRYQNLIERASLLSQSKECRYVLTGHTSSDRAETLIMNLARGTDLKGLTTLREKRILSTNIELVRPLLIFTRQETAAICENFKLPIWVDPSNQNLKLARNKIRLEILPLLEGLHAGCSLRIAALAERLTHYQEDQKAMAIFAIEAIQHPEGLCRKKLIKLPLTARSTLLMKWLEKFDVPKLSSVQLEEISKKISKNNPPGYIQISSEWEIRWSRESVQISKIMK